MNSFQKLSAEIRVKMRSPEFFAAYLKKTDISQARLAALFKTTRQNVNRYYLKGGNVPKRWLDVMAREYNGSETEFWKLVQSYCL